MRAPSSWRSLSFYMKSTCCLVDSMLISELICCDVWSARDPAGFKPCYCLKTHYMCHLSDAAGEGLDVWETWSWSVEILDIDGSRPVKMSVKTFFVFFLADDWHKSTCYMHILPAFGFANFVFWMCLCEKKKKKKHMQIWLTCRKIMMGFSVFALKRWKQAHLLN